MVLGHEHPEMVIWLNVQRTASPLPVVAGAHVVKILENTVSGRTVHFVQQSPQAGPRGYTCFLLAHGGKGEPDCPQVSLVKVQPRIVKSRSSRVCRNPKGTAGPTSPLGVAQKPS